MGEAAPLRTVWLHKAAWITHNTRPQTLPTECNDYYHTATKRSMNTGLLTINKEVMSPKRVALLLEMTSSRYLHSRKAAEDSKGRQRPSL
eukprot:3747115-Amphidinium_carterae.1